MERKLFYVFIFVFVLGAVSAFNINLKSLGNAVILVKTCHDGTYYGECSTNNKLYCDNGNLVDNCDVCGCADGFNCYNSTCIQAVDCESGKGDCMNECKAGFLEYLPLTSSCNTQENTNGSIDISNSKIIRIKSLLINSNKFRILENIYVNAFIEGTSIKDGYSLLVLYPDEKYTQDLTLEIPDTIDKTNNYLLHTQVSYGDNTLSEDYEISARGGRFTFTIRNFSVSGEERIRLGNDLNVYFEVINKKCCITNYNKAVRFFGYCGNNGVCSDTKPLICENGILVENRGKCGCAKNENCGIDGRCTIKITSQEIEKFYSITNIDKNEQSILGNLVRDYSRIPRSVEKPNITIEDKKLKISIEDIKVEGLVTDKKLPQINIDLGD